MRMSWFNIKMSHTSKMEKNPENCISFYKNIKQYNHFQMR